MGMLRRVNISGERNKLKPKFRKPYVVKKVLDRNRYVVGDLDGYQVTGIRFEGVFDPLNMRLYQRSDSRVQEDNSLEDDTIVDYQDVEYLEDEDSDIEYQDVEYLEEEG